MESNWVIVDKYCGRTKVCALDWSEPKNTGATEEASFPVILTADPLYSPEHPKLLVNTVGRWLARSPTAKFVVAVPLRDGYESERTDMSRRLLELGLEIEEEGRESGYDDWEGAQGQRQEVEYVWSIWKGTGMWYEPKVAMSDQERSNDGECN